MEETLFYIFGLALVALALVTSAIGLRMEKFPGSKPVLAIGTALFAVLVVATAAFAWVNGEEEQDHRNAEIAAGELPSPQEGLAMAQEGVDEGPAPADDAGGSEQPAPAEEPAPSEEQDAGAEDATASVDGAQVFEAQGCGGCHALADAGSTATTGPDLDGALAGKDEEYVRVAIIDPNDQIAEGYPPDVMPQTYEDQLSPEELDALVSYLAEVTAKG